MLFKSPAAYIIQIKLIENWQTMLNHSFRRQSFGKVMFALNVSINNNFSWILHSIVRVYHMNN